MRDYHKGVTIRLTTDSSSATMDSRRLENYISQVLRKMPVYQESYTPLTWSEVKNWGAEKWAQGRICGEKVAFIRSGGGWMSFNMSLGLWGRLEMWASLAF